LLEKLGTSSFQPWLLLCFRLQLAKIIPGLRPWEVLSIEQAMDQITYGGQWYREPLGSYTTGPPYIRHWNKDVKVWFCVFLLVFISSFFFFLLEVGLPTG